MMLKRRLFFNRKQCRTLNVLFFGSDEFSLEALKLLHRSNHLITNLEVVCPVDQRKGYKRKLLPVPVKEYSIQNNIKYHHPNDEVTLKTWTLPKPSNNEEQFDIGVVVSFRYFIPKFIINQFKKGAINVHPSLLPKYRGAAPIHHTILNDERETGVSIIELDTKKMDFGNILDQYKIEIDNRILYSELYTTLSILGAERCLYVLKNIDELRLNGSQNNNEISIHANKIHKNDGRLNVNENKLTIYNKWRAFGDNITLFTFFKKKRIIIRNLEIREQEDIKSIIVDIGSFIIENDLLKIRVNDGYIYCSLIQIEGLKISSISKLKKEFQIEENTIYNLD